MNCDKRSFIEQGFCLCKNVLQSDELDALAGEFADSCPGERRFKAPGALGALICAGKLFKLAREFADGPVRPTRLILFDKTQAANWSLGWHQDRTIAVGDRVACDGFDVWSKKAGVWHVEPPFEFIERTITLRLSLDSSDAQNGALEALPGSHKFGRLDDRQVSELARGAAPALLATEPGDVIVLATAIVHRSRTSQTPRRRRVVQADYSWATLPSPLQWAFP